MLNKIVYYGEKTGIYRFLIRFSPYPVQLNPPIKSVKNSIVYITGFNKSLISLDNSNKIILLRNTLNNKDFLILPIINTIISNSQFNATQISWKLRSKGFKTQVSYLTPWAENTPIKLEDNVYHPQMNDKMIKFLVGHTVQNSNPNSKIVVTIDNDINELIIKSLLNGSIVIGPNHPPLNELIIHGHNGFLFNNFNDLTDIINELNKNYNWISHNARMSISSLLKSDRYLEHLLYPENFVNINQFEQYVASSERKWLIRSRRFEEGKVHYFPSKYSKAFNVIDLNTIEEVLSYFVTQQFGEVYVFGIDLVDKLSRSDEAQLQRLIIRLGKRSLKMHFCRDKPIPKSWTRIFNKLSIVSIKEGLKQVSS